jgi:hypothetical protein
MVPENVFIKIRDDVRKSNRKHRKYLRLLERHVEEDVTSYLESQNVVSLLMFLKQSLL